MKYILKNQPPRELIAWTAKNAGLPSLHYDSSGFPREVVHESLIVEQGAICAYTMRRIDKNCSHIEHLKPQAKSEKDGKPEETANYCNIVACYPHRHIRGEPTITFGAIFRGNNWDVELFLTPLNETCEERIRFGSDGVVRPGRSNDSAAKWTIKKLGLSAPILTEWRRNAIEARGLSLFASRPATIGEAERIVANICTQYPSRELDPYCVAIKHAAEEYIKLLRRRAKRTKYIRAEKKKRRK